MAARPPKPPELTATNEEEENLSASINQRKHMFIDDNSSSESILKENISYLNQQQQQQPQNRCIKISKKTDCPCTNISIMHLFHEMKQKFPTVPDNIVNQCVVSNCHDRENCIRSLQNELNLHSSTSQSYPSNALRNQTTVIPSGLLQQQNINTAETVLLYDYQQSLNNQFNNTNKVLLKPTRPAPVPQVNLKNTNCDVAKNNFISKPVQRKLPMPSNNQNQQFISVCDTTATDNRINASSPPQRPTTLKFREPILHENKFIQNFQDSHNTINNKQLKPVRKAPAPPVSITSPSGGNITPLSSCSSQHATPTTSSQKSYSTQNFPNFDHSYSSSIQSPFSDSNESEISVNISLSPTSERSRLATTTTGQHAQPQTPRRITSITLQPEPPYTRDFAIQNPPSQRSYTSVNLTLRKPSSTPQLPIDITAGPGLTYSSSSFDAGRGLQKNFHISVNAEGGVFRASSLRPKSFYMPPLPHPEEEFRNIEPPNVLRSASSEQNFYKNCMDSTCDKFNKNITLDSPLKEKGDSVSNQLIERQKVRKEQLIKTIEKNRKKLQQVQEEIHILKSPELPGESERLDNDIEILRNNCEHLFNEIENSKRLAGQQITSNTNEYNSNNSNSQLRQRPPRPPPPRLTYLTSGSQSAPNNSVGLIVGSSSMSSPASISSNNSNSMTIPQTSNINYNTTINNLTDEDGPQWSCKHCTFLNDPLMIRCENCDYDREIPGTLNTITTNTNHSLNEFNSSNNFEASFINNSSNINNNNHNNNNSIDGLLTSNSTISKTSESTSNSASFVDNTSYENNNLPTATTAYNCL